MTEAQNALILRGKRVTTDEHGNVCLNDLWKLAGEPENKRARDWYPSKRAKALDMALRARIGENFPNSPKIEAASTYYTAGRGTKALTLNKPNAIVIGEPGFDYTAGSDEYGTITFEKSSKSYKVGDQLEVIIPHCDPVVNEYDFMYGIRKDKVESILPILARGKSQ